MCVCVCVCVCENSVTLLPSLLENFKNDHNMLYACVPQNTIYTQMYSYNFFPIYHLKNGRLSHKQAQHSTSSV